MEMSGNSWTSALQTAPMVTALGAGRASASATSSIASAPGSASSGASGASGSMCVCGESMAISPCPLRSPGGSSAGDASGLLSSRQERELVFADLQLIAVREPVRVDAVAVDVGAVQRAAVVEVVVAASAHDERVVAGHGDVVEEDVVLRPPTHRDPVTGERKALARTASAGADHERRAPRDHARELDRLQLAGLADPVGGRAHARRLLARGQKGAAALAVARTVIVGEAALGTVLSHGSGRSCPVAGPRTSTSARPRARRAQTGCRSAAGRRHR